MENPKNYKYSKEHNWIKVNGSEGIVGIQRHIPMQTKKKVDK